jgi:WD40 repeat protein
MSCKAGSKAINAIDINESSGLVLAAEFDPHVRVYDPRAQEASIVKFTLSSHHQPVMDAKWSPVNTLQVWLC